MTLGFLAFILIVGLPAFLAVALVVWAVSLYNQLVGLKQSVARSWSDIDVLLKRRHDEIMKLVDVVKGYAQFEQATLQKVIQARSAAVDAPGVTEKSKAEGELSGLLRQLFALSESYPDLKANASFSQLQKQISEIETQIMQQRESFNQTATVYNTKIQQIPDVIVARLMNYTAQDLFKAPSGTEEAYLNTKISF